MAKPVKVWLPQFLRFIAMIRITSKEADEPVPIIPYEAQQRFLRALCDGLDAGAHHFVVLKARQLGISTILLALDIFWLYMHPGLQGALIADTAENKDAFRQTITEMLESLPPRFRVPIIRHNRGALVLANGSRLQYMSAGKNKNSGLGRSRALNYVHACCAPGTPVIVEHGRVKPIEDVRVGDVVLTHTGERTVIVDAVGQPNTKGDLIKITPWLGQALSFTSEHTIPTQRGIIEAKDVQKGDWLVMPVREITEEEIAIELPVTPIRHQGAGSISIGSGFGMFLTEELGFACGYYLAEGSILRSKGSISGVQFARHRNERAYAARALAAISTVTSGWRTLDRKDSLTSVEFAYGASFARWLDATFGSLDDKRIPDDVFTWGEDFCRGLLTGILIGDGSKSACSGQGYDLPRVTLPTTRASLAMQTRDLAAALGYGWASMSVKAAGQHYGRNCKACWRVVWTGDAARSLRGLMGLPETPAAKRNWIQRYKIEDGQVYLKIRKIEGGIKADTIYDLSVAHEDHTFRTPFMAVGNTECSSWGDQKGLDSLVRALAEKNPNRLYVFESTALGYNLFFDMCEEAKEDSTKKFVFIGWWGKHLYRLDRGTEEYERWWGCSPKLTEEEEHTFKVVKELYEFEIDDEQWAYYRKLMANTDEHSAKEEMPSTENEAFQATGNSFFSLKRITTDQDMIARVNVSYSGYRYILGTNFSKVRMEEVRIPDDVELRVWEQPVKEGRYVLGVDPAYGRDEDKDRSTIEVYRCYADKLVQVAEYNTPWPETRQVAWVMAHLAGCYRDCMVNLEITGPGGEVMVEMQNLRQQMQFGSLRDMGVSLDVNWALDQARWYLYHRPDAMGPGYMYNWKTSYENKQRLLNRMRDAYDTDQLIIRSMPLLHEMTTFVQDGGKLHASGRNKDDRVMATSLANFAWSEWVRPDMMVRNMTFEIEQAKANERSLKGGTVVEWLIPMHFENMRKARAEEDLRRLMES